MESWATVTESAKGVAGEWAACAAVGTFVLDRRTQPEGRVMVSFRQPEIKSLAVAGSDPILEELVRTAGRCGARGAGK